MYVFVNRTAVHTRTSPVPLRPNPSLHKPPFLPPSLPYKRIVTAKKTNPLSSRYPHTTYKKDPSPYTAVCVYSPEQAHTPCPVRTISLLIATREDPFKGGSIEGGGGGGGRTFTQPSNQHIPSLSTSTSTSPHRKVKSLPEPTTLQQLPYRYHKPNQEKPLTHRAHCQFPPSAYCIISYHTI